MIWLALAILAYLTLAAVLARAVGGAFRAGGES